MPNLDALRQDEEAVQVDPKPMPLAGAGGSGGAAAGSSNGAGSPSLAGSAAGGAPSAGSGGSSPIAGAPAMCVPRGAETCNDADDDCNGVVDDGCPSGVTTVFDTDFAAVGDSPGGTVFADDCKDGEVLVGIDASMGGLLEQVRGVCRKVTLELSADAPSGYAVRLVDDAELPAHPETTSDAITELACMENEALVGLRISQQPFAVAGANKTVIPSLWISCAKLTLFEEGDGFGIKWEGKRELPPAVGAYSNNTAWFHDLPAPEGVVPTRLSGASGDWIDRVGFGVSKLQVAVAQ